MNHTLVARNSGFNSIDATLGFTAAIAAAALLLFVTLAQDMKEVGIVLSAVFCLVAGYLLGNVRLSCLLGLALTIPFDLTKRFGPVIQKMGGENGFRLELSDAFLI